MRLMKRNAYSLFIVGITFIISVSSCISNKSDLSKLNLGISTNYSNADAMKQNGYLFVEENVGRFLIPTKDEEEFLEIVKDLDNTPLPVKACNSFLPKDLKSVGPDAVHPEILTFAETAFRRAKQVGVEIIVFGSGGSRSIPDGFSRDEAESQFIELCKQIATIAKEYDVVMVLEPLNTNECNFINSVAEGGEIVKKVNHPNFRLLADIYHMKMEDETPDNIVLYGDLIKHVHIAEKQDRAVPGTYNEDFSPYFDALRKIKYDGDISIEARWTDFDSQMPNAITSLKHQLSN